MEGCFHENALRLTMLADQTPNGTGKRVAAMELESCAGATWLCGNPPLGPTTPDIHFAVATVGKYGIHDSGNRPLGPTSLLPLVQCSAAFFTVSSGPVARRLNKSI